MFKIGDTVVHPGMGVCKIENIKAESFGRGVLRQFYVLKPIYDNNSCMNKSCAVNKQVNGCIFPMKNFCARPKN